jgi:lysophospholipase L1-like esterase
VRFLALGDSYTIGEGVAEEERWPSLLTRRLDREGLRLSDVQLIAQTAWTADELADAIDGARPRGPFNLVTLMVGVNDQYRSRPTDVFAPEYERLVQRSIAFAGGKPRRVIAISIPDWGATPFASGRDRSRIGREIDDYNLRARELALRAGVTWVDVTPASRATLSEPSLVTADGLHPSGQMYERWAELIAPAAIAALSEAPR